MKTIITRIFIGLIFLIVFNVLFFFIGGTERSTTEWISYAFIHLAYLLLVISPFMSSSSKGDMVQSASIQLRAGVYFITELIVGLAFILINPESPTAAIIVQTILLGIFLFFQFGSVLSNEKTKETMLKQKQERVYIKALAENLKETMHKIEDPALRKQLANCYESLSSSSIESFPEAIDAELELENAVNTLCSTVERGDQSQLAEHLQSVQGALKRRNQAIKMARFS